MANDPLSVSDVLTESLNEADYQAVYATLMATERGRNFLAAHNSGHLHSDTRKFLSTVARLEAAMRDNPVQEIPVTIFRGLAALARAIEQSQAVLSSSSISVNNDLLAVERIQDIGMALRRRDVEPALCDALEVAAREVGDAMVRSNAASAGMLSAASLLSDLSASVANLIALFDSAKSPGAKARAAGEEVARDDAAFDERATAERIESLPSSASEQTADNGTPSGTDAERFHLTVGESATDADSTGSAKLALISSPLGELPLTSPLPEGQVQAGLQQASGPPLEPRSETASQITAGAEHAVGPEIALPSDILPPMAPVMRRKIQNDALADVLALSDEELIALFS
ncbi:MAG: hypothetical protein WBD95_00545 [Xanthobacteraceae bacterium]